MPMPNAAQTLEELNLIKAYIDAGREAEIPYGDFKFIGGGKPGQPLDAAAVQALKQGTYPGGGIDAQLAFWQQEASGGKKNRSLINKLSEEVRKGTRKVSQFAQFIPGPVGAAAKIINATSGGKDKLVEGPAGMALELLAGKYVPGMLPQGGGAAAGAASAAGAVTKPMSVQDQLKLLAGGMLTGGVAQASGGAVPGFLTPSVLEELAAMANAAGLPSGADQYKGLTANMPQAGQPSGKTAGGFDKDLWRNIRQYIGKDALGADSGLGKLLGNPMTAVALPFAIDLLSNIFNKGDKGGGQPTPAPVPPKLPPAATGPAPATGLPQYTNFIDLGIPTYGHARQIGQAFRPEVYLKGAR